MATDRYPRTFSGRIASQMAGEFSAFLRLLNDHGVQSYLEIGSREGDSFHEIMISLPRGSRGVAVDMPGGHWGKPTSSRKLMRAVHDLKRRGYDVSYFFGDSTADGTFEEVKSRGPYDAVLIDGDHRYEGVKSDWLRYGKLAPIVAFHDIVGTGQKDKHGSQVEVPRLWAELKPDHKHQEYVDDGSAMGIGVLFHE